MTGRPINEDRQNAIALGLKTYTGAVHSKCGTTERYVSGGGCVHCAREIATAQREALKILKASTALDKAQAEDGVDFVNQGDDEPLDNGDVPALSAFDQAIEDML